MIALSNQYAIKANIMTTMEKVAYKEKAEHKYVHVTDFNPGRPAHAKWSEADRQCGSLIVESHDGDFLPELWCFVGEAVEIGVHKEVDLNLDLQDNADPVEAAEENPMNHY